MFTRFAVPSSSVPARAVPATLVVILGLTSVGCSSLGALGVGGGGNDRDAQSRKADRESLAASLPKVDPGPGRDRAPVRPPPWCSVVNKKEGASNIRGIGRAITSAETDWSGLLTAAEGTCRDPNEPEVQQAVAVIEQLWINRTGLSEPEALETFTARLARDKFEADKGLICDALKISEEVGGEEKAFTNARRELLGCGEIGRVDRGLRDGVDKTLSDFLDVSAGEPDELARLLFVAKRSKFALAKENLGDRFINDLVRYAVDQIDFQALSTPKIMALLDAPPFKGNTYARAMVLESLGRARMALAIIDPEVKKLTSDPDWKELLITAPNRGVAEWTKKAAQHKEALARSSAFERKFWGPSRKALKGCWSELNPDFVTLAKSRKRSNPNEIKESLSDPVASLIFQRLATCAAVDGEKPYADVLIALAEKLRYARGPRVAAYYASLDAMSKILADRQKFPVRAEDLPFPDGNALLRAARDAAAKDSSAADGFVGDPVNGTVKSTKKVAEGIEITFVTVKHQEMGYECTDTKRIFSFDRGKPTYYRDCKATGMVTIDDTPSGVTVPAAWAQGISPGAVVELKTGLGAPPKRLGMPQAVYPDATKKKLVNWYGFALGQ